MPTPTITRQRPYNWGPDWTLSPSGLCLQHRGLSSFHGLVHGFSLRHHPTSEKELDLGSHSAPSSPEVKRLRNNFVISLSSNPMQLVLLRQYHSVQIHCLDRISFGDQIQRGDALITRVPQLLLAVQVADCLPLLIADEASGVVAAIHAGWRGLLGGIVPKTLARMHAQYNCNPRHCVAVVGPCIGPCCYQVSNELATAFEVAFGSRAPRASNYLDLPAICRWQLEAAGLQDSLIFSNPPCTSCQRDMFFSYRADQGTTGRMLAVIGKLS